MKIKLAMLTVGCLAVAFLACSGGSGEPADPVTVRQNEAVDAQTRAQIQLLNTRLLNGFLTDDGGALLRELFVDDVLAEIESGPGLSTVFQQIRDVLTDTTIVPFHEFDLTIAETGGEPIEIQAEDGRGFGLTLKPTSRRMHVSLIEARAGFRDHLIAMVYTRPDPADEIWRLQALRVGGLRVGGKNAVEWYGDALGLSEQELYVPAAMRLLVAGGLLRPVPFMHYDSESVVRDLEQRVSGKLAEAHAFPLELATLPGAPSIIRLEPVFQRRQLLTLVSYVSGKELTQAKVDAEVRQIQESLTAMLPGLCHASIQVAYKAFSEPPTDPQKTYTFINAVAPCL